MPAPQGWKVDFSHSFSEAEGLLFGSSAKILVSELLNTELLNELSTRSETAADVFERAVTTSLRRLSHVGSTASTRTSMGLALANVGNFKDAKSEFEKVIQLEPTFAAAHLGLARTLLAEGDAMGAEEAVWDLLNDSVFGSAAHSIRADALLRLGNSEECIATLRHAKARWPDDPTIPLNLGVSYVSLQQIQQAAGEFRACLKLDPRNGEAQNGLGLCYVQMGAYRKAIRAFRSGMESGGKSPKVVHNLAKLYERLKRYSEGRELLESHLVSHGRDLIARYYFARAMLLDGDPKSAVSEFQQVLKECEALVTEDKQLPDEVPLGAVWNDYAVASRQGGLSDHVDKFQEAIAYGGSAGVTASLNLARFCLSEGNLTDAESFITRAESAGTRKAEVAFLQAVLKYEYDDFDGALRALLALRDQGEATAESYIWMATLTGDWLGDYRRALALASEGWRKFSKPSRLANSIAYILIKTNNIEGAEALIKGKRWPSHLPTAQATHGLLKLAKGDFHGGMALYKLAMSMASSSFAEAIDQKRHFESALFHLKNGNQQTANREFDHILSDEPKDRISYHLSKIVKAQSKG